MQNVEEMWHTMKIKCIFQPRQMIPVLVFTLLIICTVNAQAITTAANGDPYILVIRDPGHPISTDEISQWTRELGGENPLTQDTHNYVTKTVSHPKLSDQQKIVAYGYYRDKNGAGHEFEYDIANDKPGQPYSANSVQSAATAWVDDIGKGQENTGTVTVSQNDDWPVVLTKTRHLEMQPYGKLTNVWELRKKAESSPGKADFAIRTHALVEPGTHAWSQSSKWMLDNTQPFLDVTHDWSVCSNNLTINSFEPAGDVMGREEKNMTVQLLPVPAFSYVFTKPELTLVESDLSLEEKTGVWHMDFYAHSPAKTPEQIFQGMMPGSSAEIDSLGSGQTVNLLTLEVSGHFINPDTMDRFDFGLGDMVHYSG
jgi:hypothetical protein